MRTPTKQLHTLKAERLTFGPTKKLTGCAGCSHASTCRPNARQDEASIYSGVPAMPSLFAMLTSRESQLARERLRADLGGPERGISEVLPEFRDSVAGRTTADLLANEVALECYEMPSAFERLRRR
jgi:hypothetical protein